MARQVKAKTTALVNYDEQAAREAEALARSESTATRFIGTRGGMFNFGNGQEDDNIDAVIVDYIFENAYYRGPFDPKSPKPPVCYAYGEPDPNGTQPDMVPHPDVQEKQSEGCRTCKQNAWGSAVRDGRPSKGKACKNIRRLAIIPLDSLKSADSLLQAEVMFLKPPVTSIVNFSNMIKTLAITAKVPPWFAAVNISIEKDRENQHTINFAAKSVIKDPAVRAAIYEKRKMVRSELLQPYSLFAETEPEEKQPRKRAKYASR